MPWLINPTDQDLFAPQIHRNVLPFGNTAISDAEAELFTGNTIWVISDEDPSSEYPESEVRASRRQVTRGGARAEIDGPPPMETR